MSIRVTSATSLSAPKTLWQQPPSSLEATTALSTFGLSGVLGYAIATSVGAPEIAATIGGVGVALTALMLGVRRWTPAFGAVFALVATFLMVGPAPDDVLRELTQPADPLYLPLMLFGPLVAIGIISGVAFTVQNLRTPRQARTAPRWLYPLLALAVGASVGGVSLGALPRPSVNQSISADVLATLPTIRVSGFAYDQSELHVRTGETVALRFENSDAATHTFTVDELGVDVPILPGNDNMAVFRPTQPGTYTFYCKPHYDPSTGQGMHGTLIVE